MDFGEKMFALIHGLSVDEPKGVLALGPSAPSFMEKFDAEMRLNAAMGTHSEPTAANVPLLEKLLAPRDSRLSAAIMPVAANPPPRFTPDGGSFAKNSESRLEAFKEMALKLFPNNPEEVDAMVQLGKQTLRDERVAMLIDLAG